MPPESPTVQALARRLLERAGTTAAGSGAPDPVAAAELVTRALAAELSRWFGPYAYHALLMRALARARVDHPVLAAVRVRAQLEPDLDGLADGARTHGADAMTEGVVTVLTTLVQLLGRVIGEDMAVRLVDQAAPGAAPGAIDTPNERGTR